MHTLTVHALDLKVIITTGDEFSWTCSNCDTSLFRVTENDGSITISQDQKCSRRSWLNAFPSHFPTLSVVVPRSIERCNVTNENGCILLDELRSIHVRSHMNNGKIDVKNLTCDDAHITCANGMINAEHLLIHSTCRLHTDNGKMQISDIANETFGYLVSCDNGISKVASRFYGNKQRDGHPMYDITCSNGMAYLT